MLKPSVCLLMKVVMRLEGNSLPCMESGKMGVGEIKERFVGIIHVSKTDSESLVNQIKHFMMAKDIQVKRMQFMPFDGANNMSGERTGWC